MKFSLPISCSCGEVFALEISGSQIPDYAECPACHQRPYLVRPLGNVVTLLLVERSKQELVDADISLSIVLSTMAVEAEMAYLFFKWKGIDSEKLPSNRTQEDQNQWEIEWSEMRSMGNRLEKLSELLTSKNFDAFVIQNKKLLLSALVSYDPAASFKAFFQEQLFERRNRIIHYGEVDFGKSEGEQCFGLASALIGLLTAMDRERIRRMDEEHRRANS